MSNEDEYPILDPNLLPSLSDKSKEVLENILEDVISGVKLEDAARKSGIHPRTLFRWISASEETRQLLSSARELRAETLMDELNEYTKADSVTPDNYNSVRVISDNLKWLITKSNPRRYGDRIQQDITLDARVTPVINVTSSTRLTDNTDYLSDKKK